jgi:hypothetical protein
MKREQRPEKSRSGADGWKDIKMVELYTRPLKAGKQYNKYSPMDYVDGLDD